MHWWSILWENECKFSTEVQCTSAFQTTFSFVSSAQLSTQNLITSSGFAGARCSLIFGSIFPKHTAYAYAHIVKDNLF